MGIIRHFFSGLRFRLLVVVLMVCAPLVALTLLTAGDQRRTQLRAWEEKAHELTELASREEIELVSVSRTLLLAFAESTGVRGEDERETKDFIERMFLDNPRYANIGVIRADGRVLASSLPLPGALLREEQQFFKRVLARKTFSVGRYSGDGSLGSHLVYFGYPVLAGQERVQSVVFATVDLEWFERSKSEIPAQLPTGAFWTKLDASGTILTRFPDPAKWVGGRFPDTNLVQIALEQKNGAVRFTNELGVAMAHAFSTLPSQLASKPVLTVLSIPEDVLFSDADHVMYRNLSWLGIAGGIALLLGMAGSNLLVLRPLHGLVRYTTRLVTGGGHDDERRPLPKGRHELGLLTSNFNRIAEALLQSETEHRFVSQKVQALSHRLVEVQEKERRQIARELHDEIGQSLTAAEMHLQAAIQTPQGESLVKRLEESLQAVEQVLQQVHDLSLNLRPSMLDDLGLEPALRWYARRQAEAAGLELDFFSEPLERRLSPLIETECFRIGQEAITNVIRHAKASKLIVELKTEDGALHLLVSDDGVGFEPVEARSRAVHGASLGLLSMEERAGLSGGTLQFKSSPGEGTRVHAQFPLRYYEPESSLHE